MKNFKIIADSSADTFKINSIPFACAPMKIITAEQEFVDDCNLNIEQMVDFLAKHKEKSSTSCPNPEDWISAFNDAENVFCVTITAALSGSYNSALTAKEIYLEEHPDRNVFVINSLSAGPELRLVIEKLGELILSGLEFSEICQKITEYMNSTALVFMLESLQNLANNGRVSPLVAKAAGILGIRLVGKASSKGELEPIKKCRGEEKALRCIVEEIANSGYKNGKIRIAHCFNLKAAAKLKQKLENQFANAQIEIYDLKGLCSFYAEKGGLLIGFEKF